MQRTIAARQYIFTKVIMQISCKIILAFERVFQLGTCMLEPEFFEHLFIYCLFLLKS